MGDNERLSTMEQTLFASSGIRNWDHLIQSQEC